MAKNDGRKVRELNQDISASNHQLRQSLYEVLGEVDPVKVQRALRQALSFSDDIQHTVFEIELICAEAAKRGTYNTGSDE